MKARISIPSPQGTFYFQRDTKYQFVVDLLKAGGLRLRWDWESRQLIAVEQT